MRFHQLYYSGEHLDIIFDVLSNLNQGEIYHLKHPRDKRLAVGLITDTWEYFSIRRTCIDYACKDKESVLYRALYQTLPIYLDITGPTTYLEEEYFRLLKITSQ